MPRPMMDFESVRSAATMIIGIQTDHMIRKDQRPSNGNNVFDVFTVLATKWRKGSAFPIAGKFVTETHELTHYQ